MINVSIVVEDTADLNKVSEELAKVGFVLDGTLPNIGILTGSVAEGSFNKLYVPGVVSVERSRDDNRVA